MRNAFGKISQRKQIVVLWVGLVFLCLVLLVVGVFMKKTRPTLLPTSQISPAPTPSPQSSYQPWWETIIHTELDYDRTWSQTSKSGRDICGYTETDIKQMTNVAAFENPENNAIVHWDSSIWSPKCSRLLFTIDTQSMKGNQVSPIGGVWIYDVASKKRYMLPKFTTFRSFLNDDVILINRYQVYDLKSSRVIADIGPSHIRFRNPGFPWTFLYGIDWKYLPSETISNNGSLEKIVFLVHDNLKIELYKTIPAFDKSRYKIQQLQIFKTGPFTNDKSIAYTLDEYYDLSGSGDDRTKMINCEKWYTNSASRLTPGAIHITNRASEWDCQYMITTEIDNIWISGNEFQFILEFAE